MSDEFDLEVADDEYLARLTAPLDLNPVDKPDPTEYDWSYVQPIE